MVSSDHCEAHVSILCEPEVGGQGVRLRTVRYLFAERESGSQPGKVPFRTPELYRGQSKIVDVRCESTVNLSRTWNPGRVFFDVDAEDSMRRF